MATIAQLRAAANYHAFGNTQELATEYPSEQELAGLTSYDFDPSPTILGNLTRELNKNGITFYPYVIKIDNPTIGTPITVDVSIPGEATVNWTDPNLALNPDGLGNIESYSVNHWNITINAGTIFYTDAINANGVHSMVLTLPAGEHNVTVRPEPFALNIDTKESEIVYFTVV